MNALDMHACSVQQSLPSGEHKLILVEHKLILLAAGAGTTNVVVLNKCKGLQMTQFTSTMQYSQLFWGPRRHGGSVQKI
jgi:hypothetical protein